MKDPALTGKLKIGDVIIAYRAPFFDDIECTVYKVEGGCAFTKEWKFSTQIYFGKTVYRYRRRDTPWDMVFELKLN